MASDIVELAAEVTSMRSLLVLIAPMAFEDAGVRPEMVEEFAQELSKHYSTLEGVETGSDAIAGFTEASVRKVNKLFAEVIENMRLREEARASAKT